MILFQIDQLNLALPSREYYLKNSSKSDLQAYLNYMTKIALLVGADPATVSVDIQEVLDFEIQLANVSLQSIKLFFSIFLKKIKLTFYCHALGIPGRNRST